uniref:Uncharacterized protein n=1 Tax=Oryza punctata TaxID=4537 RepID=A0A0E0MLS5_ORYPU
MKKGFNDATDKVDATAMYEAGLKIVDRSTAKREALWSVFDNITEVEQILRAKEAKEGQHREKELWGQICQLRRDVEEVRERGKREAAGWKKLVDKAEATWDEPGLRNRKRSCRRLGGLRKRRLNLLLLRRHTTLRNLQADVDIQYQHFQRELDTAKGLREELVKLLEPTLKLLFPSRCEGKDPVQLTAELVPEGPTVGCQPFESVVNLNASHALMVVKSHYPQVDLDAMEEGYAADCSE